MTQEVLKQALEALELLSQQPTDSTLDYADNAITALRERLAQPAQEPTLQEQLTEEQIWKCNRVLNENGEIVGVHICLDHQNVVDFARAIEREIGEGYVAGYKAQEPDFGPQPDMHYGMNQDDWKDIVAAISKARDSRGIYLGCRPADVFQDWFLAMGLFKPKEKNA